MKKRRLADLFVVGKEIVFDDGQGEPITIWLQKLNPVEHETAMRRANGARSTVLTGKNEVEREIADDDAAEFGRDGWVEFLASDALGRKIPALEAELAAEEEWSKDDYLQGLKDVWDASMQKALEEDPDDPSALRVRDELERFRVLLDAHVERERDSLVAEFNSRSDEDLQKRVVEKLLQTRADIAWLSEFRRCEVWLSTRLADDHRKKYFESRDEVDDLSQEVLIRLMNEYQDLGVDPLEGKDSGAMQPSSNSPESSDQEETVEPSGPEVAVN